MRRKGERRAPRRLHSIREPDDFIAAEGRQTLRRTRNTSGKSLKGFTNSRSMEILMWWTYLLLLSTSSLANSLKMSASKNGGEYEPCSVSSFQKSILESSPSSSYFSACRFSSTKSSTRLRSYATSFCLRVNKHPLNFRESFHENAAKHQKLGTNCWSKNL